VTCLLAYLVKLLDIGDLLCLGVFLRHSPGVLAFRPSLGLYFARGACEYVGTAASCLGREALAGVVHSVFGSAASPDTVCSSVRCEGADTGSEAEDR
jgi:hypothetical protein